MPAGAVYVGRPSRWGNPFRIYRGHHLIGPSWSVARATWTHLPADECWQMYTSSSRPLGAADVVRPFEDLLTVRRRDEPELLAAWLTPLRGRDLACWCPLDQPCHADALLRFANPSPDPLEVLRTARWPGYADEYGLQAAAENALARAGLIVQREVVLSARDRLDLLVDGVAIECKVAGSAQAVLRQLQRYAEHEQVTSLVLLTRRAAHRLLRSTVGGKPLTVVFTAGVL